jgi:glycerol-3-phosphate dehydrogenase subunit B
MTDDVLVIGAGPAGLLAAWTARQRGARVKVLAAGIGTTHIMPGWLGVLDAAGPLTPALERLAAEQPEHPYALAGADAIQAGVMMLRQVCEPAGLNYVGDLSGNMQLPTALGAAAGAAYAPESFVAGDLRDDSPMLIAGVDGWRDFYPLLCAENLARQGHATRGVTFALPETEAGKFDATPVALARLFDRPEIRERVAHLLRPRLEAAQRVGFPAVLGLEHHNEAWHDLQDRLGAPVFEIPTLPPSVPGMRLFAAFKRALARAGVQLLLDMQATAGVVEGNHAIGVVVPGASRPATYRAGRIILATGGLYGGGITSDHHGTLREAVFGLPVETPGALGDWFDPQLISAASHPIHRAGVRANRAMQPVTADGRVLLEDVRVAGRLLAGCQPIAEGSTEGVWLATAYRAAC